MATAYVEPTTVHNPTTGQAIPAAWGDVIRDDLDAIYNGPLVQLTKAAVQSIATGAGLVAATFDTEVDDTDTMHAAGNPTRITLTKAGWYLFLCSASWSDEADTTQRRIQLYKGGVSLGDTYNDRVAANGTTDTPQNAAWLVDCAAATYVEMYVSHSAATTCDLTARFSAFRAMGT